MLDFHFLNSEPLNFIPFLLVLFVVFFRFEMGNGNEFIRSYSITISFCLTKIQITFCTCNVFVATEIAFIHRSYTSYN